MGLHHSGYCYYFMVIVVCGFLCQCDGQDNSACQTATGHHDFKIFENACFYVSLANDRREWYSAQSVCVSLNGNLATVSQQETLEFLQKNWQIEYKYYWIGLYANYSDLLTDDDLEKRRQAEWKWLDGTPYNQNGLGWHQSEPWYRDYLGVFLGTKWAAEESNQNKNYYICERKLTGDKLPPATQITPTETTQALQSGGNNDQDNSMSTGKRFECGENWLHGEDTNLCYRLRESTALISWDAAKSLCIEANSQLACPSKQSKHNAVVNITRQKEVYNKDVWIGLMHEAGAEEQNPQDGWKWVDEAPYDFRNWLSDEPQKDEKFIRLKEGTWRGIGSNKMYKYYLCQKEPTEIPTQGKPPNNPQHGETTQPIFKNTPGAGESDSKVTAKPAGNGGRKEVPVLGLALGVTFGVAIIALVAAVMFMRTRRSEQFNSMLNRLKIGPSPKKRSDDQYCDIKDEDLDRPHIYHNEIANQGYRVDRQPSSDDASVSPVQAQENRQGINGHQTASYEEVADEHQYTPLQRKN